MPPQLPTDPEILKVPAFMRRRSLASRQRHKPLILTALDRRRAGLLPEGLEKKTQPRIKPRVKPRIKKSSHLNFPQEFQFFEPRTISPPRIKQKKLAVRRRPKLIPQPEVFAPPFIDSPVNAPTHTPKAIGIITHYFNKINVGVIKLSGILSVGDCIEYETADGPYEEIVESMEIERKPVFKAKKGDDIGIKLRREPVIRSKIKILS